MAIKLNALILGYGEMGHAMEFLLADKHHVHIWSRNSTSNLEEEVAKAQVVLFCLPVNAHLEMIRRIAPKLRQDSLCLTIAKGLNESGKTAPQILESVISDIYHYGVMYGPMISEEIRVGHYAFAEVALSSRADFKIVQKLFQGSTLICRQVDDMSGSCWSVILKNVYAILFGISDELKLGDNMRGHLIVNALVELSAIVKAFGAEPHTPYSYAGLGDLLTTATSEHSHHHALGRQLASGHFSHITGEGINTLKMVQKHQLFDTHSYPLYTLVHNIVATPDNLKILVEEYLDQIRNW